MNTILATHRPPLTCSRRFFLDDGDLHVFDLDTDQEEVDLAHYNISEVIPTQDNMQSA